MGDSVWDWVVRAVVVSCSCSLSACGGGDGDSYPGGSGQVTAEWRAYCVAKFTQDYAVPDGFGDTEFTARAGEEYLLTEYDDVFGKDRAEIAYLTPAGPYTATIEVASGSRAFPFTTDCAFGSAKHYYAVFADTIVYGDKALTNRLCELRAGTVLPRNTSGSSGYSLASEFSLTGPATYEVELNAFSAQCQGAESGYVSVPDTVIFGTHTWLVPITEILGPG